MTTALAAPMNLANVPVQVGDDEVYDDLAKGGDWVRGVKLYTKGKPVDRGLIRPGHYGIYVSKDEILDLGTQVDVLPLARRPMAIDMRDRENIRRIYDDKDAEFQEIRDLAGEKDSQCQCGVEFLLYERNQEEFLAYFCGSKSTLRAARELFGYLPVDPATAEKKGIEPRGPLPVTLKVRYVEGRFSYHVPVPVECSTPFTNLPPEEELVRQIQKFLNPPKSQVERVSDDEVDDRAH